MLGSTEYKILSKYPHMGPEDTDVWTRFVAKYPNAYTSVDYDTKVGFAPAFVTRDASQIGGEIANLYLRKIDVVGFIEDEISVIEVKPRAGFTTVGQILGYMSLWRDKHGDAQYVTPVIVTGECPLDVQILAEQQGVKIFVV